MVGPEHPIEPFARQAFAAGWAVSGGPMTDRVRAGCTAAVRLAVESADDPDVLKATVDLGRLEGMWALLFQRREDLLTRNVKAVAAAWRPLFPADTITAAVDRFRAAVGLAEAAQEVQAEAMAAAQAMVHAITDEPGFADLRASLTHALAAGRAEGMVTAVALAADRARRSGLDWNAAFDSAYADVERLGAQDGADHWLAVAVDRATGALGSLLADSAARGDSHDAMADAAHGYLTSPASDAVLFTVDWAMSTAASQGALDLFRTHGVTAVWWITVGDMVVCKRCADAEGSSPWPIEHLPTLPGHPWCRCVAAADIPLASYGPWFH